MNEPLSICTEASCVPAPSEVGQAAGESVSLTSEPRSPTMARVKERRNG